MVGSVKATVDAGDFRVEGDCLHVGRGGAETAGIGAFGSSRFVIDLALEELDGTVPMVEVQVDGEVGDHVGVHFFHRLRRAISRKIHRNVRYVDLFYFRIYTTTFSAVYPFDHLRSICQNPVSKINTTKYGARERSNDKTKVKSCVSENNSRFAYFI